MLNPIAPMTRNEMSANKKLICQVSDLRLPLSL